MKIVRKYELEPTSGQKSFYRKAYVKVYEDGSEVLRSYDTDVLKRESDGTYIRLWDDWSATTGRHIKAFSGMNKKEYEAVEYRDLGEDD